MFKVGNWVLSCELGSTLAVLSEVHHRWHTHPSFHPYYLSLAVLGTIISSGCHMPSTCPNGLKLVEHQESRSSMIFLGKSMSHSRGVNSVWDRTGSQVDVRVRALTQGCGCTLGDGHWEESVMVGHLYFTAWIFRLIQGRTICDLARYFVFYFISSILHLHFSLKCVSLCPNHVSWHQLDCACKYNIISPLSVPFIVGLALGFGASSLEAFLHLLNTGRDSPKVHVFVHIIVKRRSIRSSGRSLSMR